MQPVETFEILAVSLGLGLLVGLQRQRSDAALAGIRTFPLITLLGTLLGLLAKEMGPDGPGIWLLCAGLLGVAVVTLSGNLKAASAGRAHPGITSEVTILAMYVLGAYLVYGPLSVGAVAAGVIVLLLHAKRLLHRVAARIGDKDMRAIMTFVLITLVVLPAVPDQEFPGAWGLNPRNVWLMVVLVVGMSLAGYVLFKVVGPAAGTALAGVLGGMVSSTATTASYARRAAQAPEAASAAAAVILIAGTILYARVGVEMGIVSMTLLRAAAAPLAVVAGVNIALAVFCWLGARRDGDALPEPENPTELRAALVFAALYAGVLVATSLAKEHLGDAGVFGVALVSGLTDMDAITLSVARMTQRGEIDADTAWRAALAAAASNTVFKGGMVGVLGGPELRRRLLPLMGAVVVVIAGIILFYPRTSG